jgi:hypothetical protein
MVMLPLNFKVTRSISLIHWSVVLWWTQKSNWHALSRPLCWRCLWTIFRITILNSLPVGDKNLIRHKFWGNLGSLLGFGTILTFASFQGFGKWDNQVQGQVSNCISQVKCYVRILN